MHYYIGSFDGPWWSFQESIMHILAAEACFSCRPETIIPKFDLTFCSEFSELLSYYSLGVDPLFHKMSVRKMTK